MSSGGMYASSLRVSDLQMGDDYKGSEQYARAKRAQVTLNEMWAQRVPAVDVVFHAMHPGWADTPGVRESLPTFRKIVGPLLRTPAQGVDTLVWLAADDGEPRTTSGRFWLDRHQRSIHKLPSTRKSDTPERRRELWDWVSDRALGQASS
jgi:NAD(P)-dependent dehydrogenase (short-subunit alcohol dehydrogenase family)